MNHASAVYTKWKAAKLRAIAAGKLPATPKQRAAAAAQLTRLKGQAERRKSLVLTPKTPKKSKQELNASRPRPDTCEICDDPDQQGRVLSWDHDHLTGAFRGWLCGFCNTALGLARDNPSTLRKMADYLERSRVR